MVTRASGTRTRPAAADAAAPASRTEPLPWLTEALQLALDTQRGHALLLHGPQGVGQFELSLMLARAWLCEAHVQGTNTGERLRPACGHCGACHLVDAHSHPDLLVLLPDNLREPLGWGSDAGEAGEGADKASKAKPSKEIKVEAVRAAVGFAQTTAARGRAKVVLVFPADRVNTIAANALLKTLEEPPGRARFVLATSAPDALLPTIRSRCQALALAPPAQAEAAAWLQSQGVDEPLPLLAATGGQVQEVLAWEAQGINAAAWAALPRQLARGEPGILAGLALPEAVAMLQKLCHDCLRHAAGAAPRYFPVQALPSGASLSALAEWSQQLLRLARVADHPWGPGLALEALVSRAQQVLATVRQDPARARGASVHSGQ